MIRKWYNVRYEKDKIKKDIFTFSKRSWNRSFSLKNGSYILKYVWMLEDSF